MKVSSVELDGEAVAFQPLDGGVLFDSEIRLAEGGRYGCAKSRR